MEISKIQMERAIRNLERRAAEIEDIPRFRGIPITAVEKKEHLVMLCTLFADEWNKARELNNSLLKSRFVDEITSTYYATKAHNLIQQAIAEKRGSSQSVWRKIWHRKPGGIFWFLCMAVPITVWLAWFVWLALSVRSK